MSTGRKKSLLIGINYTGSKNQLQGCVQDVNNVKEFLGFQGYPTDARSQVVMTDQMQGAYYPDGHNIIAAMDWLVSEPGCVCFFHYSGHGGQVASQSSTHFSDTLVPVDFQTKGQIDSDMLHQHLVTNLPPSSTLFVIMDCCHSGSALELPYVYRSDDDGNVNMMDNLKQGMHLVGTASHLMQDGFSFQSINDAQQLFAGATDFFRGLKHAQEPHKTGLNADDNYGQRYGTEGKMVTMFSGCKDDQTSADASIGGSHVGAMSWAFLKCMRSGGFLNYLQVLQITRQILKESNYEQVPQLSVGVAQMDLSAPLCM